MKKIALFLGIIITLSMLSGCTPIPDKLMGGSSSGGEPGSSVPPSTMKPEYNEISVKEFYTYEQDFRVILGAESGVYDGTLGSTGDFNGTGFVKLRKGNALTHILSVNTTQHYSIVLAVRSEEGASISLEAAGNRVGDYYVPKYEQKEDDPEYKFEYLTVDHIYLEAGQNVLKFTVDEGSADIDFIIAENSSKVSDAVYDVTSGSASTYASVYTVNVMRYLTEVYGMSVLTAQNVSPATNAEIDAVYNATGRYPAIRSSEISYAVLTDEENAERVKRETELALEWTKKGGLQAYTWHWLSPNYTRGVNPGDLNTDDLFKNQTPENAATLDEDGIKDLLTNGYITPELAGMIGDIDKLAAVLKQFDEQGTTVLFAPLPDGDSGQFWWGKTPESYKTIWQLVFDRICNYHKLKSLIWVWNGSDMDYFPSGMVDVIGQSFYESSDSSFAGRFAALSNNPAGKPIALTACDILPNIDYMFRDNAIWLWAAPEAGSFTINASGALSEEYNSVRKMKNFYNHTNTITLDELPDFNALF